MSSQEPTSNEVLRAARDAGLLFEQEVASAIEALEPKWSVITNRGFGDSFVFLTRPAQPFDGARQPALWFPIKAYRVKTGQKTHQEKPALSRFDELCDLHWASTASVKGLYSGG